MFRILKPNGMALISVWSKNQPEKTKRRFDSYGDQMVSWKSVKGDEYFRYYYIFKIDELIELFNLTGFKVVKHCWDCGNEIFIVKKK